MNRIIRQLSVIGLLVLAVTIGVNAQSDQQYRAEIPFAFEVAGKHHEAGKYLVGPVSRTASSAIAIRNAKTGNGQLLQVYAAQGDNNWDKPGTLTFLKVGGQYRLSQISTATFKMKMKSKKADMAQLAGATPPEIVPINLNR